MILDVVFPIVSFFYILGAVLSLALPLFTRKEPTSKTIGNIGGVFVLLLMVGIISLIANASKFWPENTPEYVYLIGVVCLVIGAAHGALVLFLSMKD